MKNNIIKRMVTGLLAATLFVGTAAVSNPTEVKAEVFYNQKYGTGNQETWGLESITPEIKSFTRTGLTTAKVKVYIPYSKEITLVSSASKCTDPNKSYLINRVEFWLSSNDNVFSKVSIDMGQEGYYEPALKGVEPGLTFETVKDAKGKPFRYIITDLIVSRNLKKSGKNTYTFTIKSNALKKYKNIYISASFGSTGMLDVSHEFLEGKDVVTTNTNTAKLTSNSSKYKCVKTVAARKHKGNISAVTYTCVKCGYTSKQYFKISNHISKYYDEGHYSYNRRTFGKDATIPTYYKYTWKKK